MMQAQLLSPRSRVFDHADPYAVSGYVNQHVGNHCILMPRAGRPLASLDHRKFASLDLCRISYGASVRVTSGALETIYHLQVLLRGNCLWPQTPRRALPGLQASPSPPPWRVCR